MTLKPIRNDDDLKRVFRHMEEIFQAVESAAHADECDDLVTSIDAYETLARIQLRPVQSVSGLGDLGDCGGDRMRSVPGRYVADCITSIASCQSIHS